MSEQIPENEVFPGDRITIGVTHQVQIDGDDAWIKAEINSAVQPWEDADLTFARVQRALRTRIEGIIESAVEPIVEMGKGK